MACLTNQSLILGIGAVGDICSGRGQCVNNLCVCDQYWTGRADLISLDGYSCQNPDIFDRLMWSFAAFMHFKLCIQALPAMRFQYQQYRTRRNSGKAHACGTFPAVAFLEFVAVPALGGIFVWRAASDHNFGVDLPLSVVFSLIFSMYLFAISFMETTLFHHLMIGSAKAGASKDMMRLATFDKIMAYTGTLFYSSIYVVSNVVPVFLPLGPTPERIGIMVLRNVGTVLYFGFYTIHHSLLRRRILSLMDPSKSNDRLNGVLARIEASIVMSRKRVIIMFVIYTLFMVCPPLFSFQYVAWSFILGIACGGNHILMQISSGQHAGEKTVSSEQNNTATGNDRIVPATSHDSRIVRQESKESKEGGSALMIDSLS